MIAYGKLVCSWIRGRQRLGTAGVAVIEFALVLPFLALLTAAAWDLGNVFHQEERLASAAEAGVDYGIQNSATSTDYTGMISAARADADDPNDALDIAAQQVCLCSGGTTVNCSTGYCSGALPNVYLQVTVSENYPTIIPYPGIGSTIFLSRQAMLRYQ